MDTRSTTKVAPTESTSEHIPFIQELLRKATHLGALAIPSVYYGFALSKTEMLTFLVPACLFVILLDISRLRSWPLWTVIASRVIGGMVRRHESTGDFMGSTYILLSMCLTVAIFSQPVAVAALAFIIVGDPFAAIIGRKFGRHRFGRKSVEGSLAFLGGTVLVASVTPLIPIGIGIVGAFAATITEALSVKVDDNISVPLVSGLVISLLLKF